MAERLENASWRMWHKQHQSDKTRHRNKRRHDIYNCSVLSFPSPIRSESVSPTMSPPNESDDVSRISVPSVIDSFLASDKTPMSIQTLPHETAGFPHVLHTSESDKQHVSSADLLHVNPFDSPTQVCGMQEYNVYAGQDLLMQALGMSPSNFNHNDSVSSRTYHAQCSPMLLKPCPGEDDKLQSVNVPKSAADLPREIREAASTSATTIPAPSSNTTSSEEAPICSNCGTDNTPLWRRDHNMLLLCNACGLYLKIHKTHRPLLLRKRQQLNSTRASQSQDACSGPSSGCTNCGTKVTPLWRKGISGAVLCNACGLYLKLHQSNRPVRYRADVIRKRSRYDNRGRISQSEGTSPSTPGAAPILPFLSAHLFDPETTPTGSQWNSSSKTPDETHTGDSSMTPNPCGNVASVRRVLQLSDEPFSSPASITCCASSGACTGPVLFNDYQLDDDSVHQVSNFVSGVHTDVDSTLPSMLPDVEKHSIWPVFPAM